MSKHPIVAEMSERLADAAGDRLVSVVLYGAAAHGDYAGDVHRYNLLIVLKDLELETIDLVGAPIRWWLKRGEPMPRLFCPEIIRDAADVFPIEFLDITAHHEVIHGSDPFADLEVDTEHLRLQCERELREKLMRLQEAFIEADGKRKLTIRLLGDSFPAFANVFRGCLKLMQANVPAHNIDAARAFCEAADLDAAPFAEIDRLKNGHKLATDPDQLFASYYAQLRKAVGAIDRFQPAPGGTS